MRRIGWIVILLVACAGCGGGEKAGKAGNGKRIRKQVGELTAADLQRHPVWEFAVDEEGEPGQDEETVRPFADVQDVDLEGGLYVVATSFEAADGTNFSGYSSPQRTANVGYIQPTIIAESGQVGFWWGGVNRGETELAKSYRILAKRPDKLFPLRWRMTVRIKGAVTEGELRGFGYLTRANDAKVIR